MVMDFVPDLLTGLQAHHDQLGMLASEEYLTKITIFQRVFFNRAEVSDHFFLLKEYTDLIIIHP
jgi:hypothetical protein